MFFLSLEDDLLRIFGSDKLDSMLSKLGLKDGESIAHPWVSKALERAQGKVESRNFDIRKNILKFDDVINVQRKEIFSQRRSIMESSDISDMFENMHSDVIEEMVVENIPEGSFIDQWDISSLKNETMEVFGLDLPIEDWAKEDGVLETDIRDSILERTGTFLKKKQEELGYETFRIIQKQIFLQVIDQSWSSHLSTLDHLRAMVGFRGYAQRDPLNEYKQEAFVLFEYLLEKIKKETVKVIFLARLVEDSSDSEEGKFPEALENQNSQKSFEKSMTNKKIRRNSPCPCGSGKKFKHCHGAI